MLKVRLLVTASLLPLLLLFVASAPSYAQTKQKAPPARPAAAKSAATASAAGRVVVHLDYDKRQHIYNANTLKLVTNRYPGRKGPIVQVEYIVTFPPGYHEDGIIEVASYYHLDCASKLHGPVSGDRIKYKSGKTDKRLPLRHTVLVSDDPADQYDIWMEASHARDDNDEIFKQVCALAQADKVK